MARNDCGQDDAHEAVECGLDLKDQDLYHEYEKMDKIKFNSLLLALHRQKINGIVPGELYNADVDNCFTETNDVGKESRLLRKKPFLEQIIIMDDNKFYKFWLFFNMIL